MRFVTFLVMLMATLSFAESPAKADSSVVDTIYVIQESGIPWNREHFDPERLIRHDTFDPALKVAYTYSVSFIGGSFGSFAQQSFMAHFAYEFTPELHLYANVGLWMPIYSSLHFGNRIAREDVKQGNVGILVPDIALEYKPNDKMTFRVMYINERDAFRAYGPHDYLYGTCSPWRNSIFCR